MSALSSNVQFSICTLCIEMPWKSSDNSGLIEDFLRNAKLPFNDSFNQLPQLCGVAITHVIPTLPWSFTTLSYTLQAFLWQPVKYASETIHSLLWSHDQRSIAFMSNKSLRKIHFHALTMNLTSQTFNDQYHISHLFNRLRFRSFQQNCLISVFYLFPKSIPHFKLWKDWVWLHPVSNLKYLHKLSNNNGKLVLLFSYRIEFVLSFPVLHCFNCTFTNWEPLLLEKQTIAFVFQSKPRFLMDTWSTPVFLSV